VLGVGVPWVAEVARHHPYFAVREVALRHRGELEPEAVRALAGVDVGSSIWDVDVDDVETRLLTNGWIRQAAVRRELPDRVVVHVRENRPVAILAVADEAPGLYYLAANGRIFAPVAAGDPRDMPFVTGLTRKDLAGDGAFGPRAVRRALALMRHAERQPAVGKVSELHVDRELGLTLMPIKPRCRSRSGGANTTKLARVAEVLPFWSGREGDARVSCSSRTTSWCVPRPRRRDGRERDPEGRGEEEDDEAGRACRVREEARDRGQAVTRRGGEQGQGCRQAGGGGLMRMAKRNPVVVGLDIGTYKVGVIVAGVGEDGVGITGSTPRRAGSGRAPSSTSRRPSMRSGRRSTRRSSWRRPRSGASSPGRPGATSRAFNSHGVVAVKKREVEGEDVGASWKPRAVALPTDREVLHVLPQEFVVDDQDGIKDPVSMTGVRLEARPHRDRGDQLGAEPGEMLQSRRPDRAGRPRRPLAAAEAVLTPEERELGVLLIDVGAGTTSLTVLQSDAIRHTAVLPVGGGHVTNDLAAALRTPFAEAERLKQRCGSAVVQAASPDLSIEVPGIGGRAAQKLSPRALAMVIEPRAEEMLALVRSEVERAGCEGCHVRRRAHRGGAVLGGMTELAERVFRTPVRLGTPLHLSGLVDVVASPMYSTAVGLVLHGLKRYAQPGGRKGSTVQSPIDRARHRVMEWLREFF
jgi:cell division protein FtsA